MRTRTRAAAVAIGATALFVPVLPAPAGAAGQPDIVRFWLVDATTDTRIQELHDYATVLLPVVSDHLSIEAQANGDTESVVMRINGAVSSTENLAPYALDGDNAGDFIPVPALRVPGYVDVSARAYSADNAGGTAGPERELTLYLLQPNFLVNDPVDAHDDHVGDTVCSTAEFDPGITTSRGRGGPPPRDPGGTLADRSATGTGPMSIAPVPETAVTTAPRSSPRRPAAPGGDLTNKPVPFGPGCTLRAAIEEANALVGEQTIVVDGTKGPFTLTLGDIEIDDGVTIIGHQRPLIDAGHLSRVFFVDGHDTTTIVNLRNLELANGRPPGTTDRGGAMSIQRGALVQMSDSIVRNSQANFGGGIYLQSGGDLTMWRSAVHSNIAGTPEDGIDGGGVTQRGGGIFNLEGVVKLYDSVVYDNLAVRGGGLSNFGGQMTIENSSVIDNEALAIGGGIENRVNVDADAVLTLAFATVAGNAAGTSGAPPADQRVGGGLYNDATAFMANSILADNTDYWWAGYDLHAPDCWSPAENGFLSYRNNVVGVLNDNCSFGDYSSGNLAMIQSGTEDDPLDPGLSARQSAGHLRFYNLLPASVALDGAAGQGAALFPCPQRDMRAQPRPAGAGCDIGAIERQ